MQVWKSIAEASSNPAKQPSTTTILQKACEMYQEYGVQQNWPDYETNNIQTSQKRPRTEDLTDVAALIAQNKSFKKYLKISNLVLLPEKPFVLTARLVEAVSTAGKTTTVMVRNSQLKRFFLRGYTVNQTTLPRQKPKTEPIGCTILVVTFIPRISVWHTTVQYYLFLYVHHVPGLSYVDTTCTTPQLEVAKL